MRLLKAILYYLARGSHDRAGIAVIRERMRKDQ